MSFVDQLMKLVITRWYKVEIRCPTCSEAWRCPACDTGVAFPCPHYEKLVGKGV